MRIKKWLMKQQWRIIQIRGIWGLFYGILLLAIAYFDYIPFFSEMNALGPFVFAVALIVIFMISGYIYDRVFVLWAPSQEVAAERNPFQYVPGPQERIYWLPLYSGLLDVMEDISLHFDFDTTAITETRQYFSKLNQLRPENREDIEEAKKLRKEFIEEHQLSDLIEKNKGE